MLEVIAATITARKNSADITVLSTGSSTAMVAKIYGTLLKMRPGPVPGEIPAANTAGIIANPASMAKVRSETAVPTLDASMFSFLLT